MTNFQVGLLVGFFLGALVMFVAIGIINLYLEARHEKRGAEAISHPRYEEVNKHTNLTLILGGSMCSKRRG